MTRERRTVPWLTHVRTRKTCSTSWYWNVGVWEWLLITRVVTVDSSSWVTSAIENDRVRVDDLVDVAERLAVPAADRPDRDADRARLGGGVEVRLRPQPQGLVDVLRAGDGGVLELVLVEPGLLDREVAPSPVEQGELDLLARRQRDAVEQVA
jgi:hypothetical protein